MQFRTERDPLGEFSVPADAYYGIQTARAVANFPISGLRAPADLVVARRVGQKGRGAGKRRARPPRCGYRRRHRARRRRGARRRLRDQFVVDVYQAGAGTSFNMNVNEVLANRAAEILGGHRGDYRLVHPNDHVNMSQSTNDVFPTATRLALLMINGALVASARALQLRSRKRLTISTLCSKSDGRTCRMRCR